MRQRPKECKLTDAVQCTELTNTESGDHGSDAALDTGIPIHRISCVELVRVTDPLDRRVCFHQIEERLKTDNVSSTPKASSMHDD